MPICLLGVERNGLHGRTMSAFERHFTVKELAEWWRLSDTKVRLLLQDEPGVMKIGEPSRRLGRKLRRRYYTLRVPESVARRVHERLTANAGGR